ncbi:MAG: PIN domain-containing protein [Terracidiphilus sp.]
MTIAADTNVWARALLNDDAAQARTARKALAEARSKGGVFVPLMVLAELAWVLRARWDRERVLTTLESLLQTRGVEVEASALAQEALEATRKGKGGFADHLIAQVSFANGAKEIVTFDGKFAGTAKVRLLK